MDYMAETHKALGRKTHHYCNGQGDNDWMDHPVVGD
jgi:hypothetical protein